MTVAYWTGAFARATKGVKPLSYYLRQIRKSDEPGSTSAQALSFFNTLKAKGFPVKITRVPRPN